MATVASRLAEKWGKAKAFFGMIVRTAASSDTSTDPTISAGSGAASEAEPNGSIYLRTDGLPEYRSGGAWSIVAPASGLTSAIIAGGAAGDHTVTGIATGDALVYVYEQDGTSGLLTDLTSEFSVSAADTISNAGGTDTTGDYLVILYWDLT